MSWDSFLAIFQESNLRSLPGKTAVNQVTKQGLRRFLQRVLSASKANLNSLKLSGDIQSLGTTLSVVTFQTKTWLIKPHLETDTIIKRIDSYWVYANKHIAVK